MSEPTNVPYGSIEINLLPSKPVRSGKQLQTTAIALIVAILMGAGFLAYTWWDAGSEKSEAAKRLQEVDKQLQTAMAKQSAANLSNPELLLKLPDTLKATSPDPVIALQELAKLLPDRVNATNMVMDKTGKFEFTGYFATTEEVISFHQALESSKNFSMISMSDIVKINAESTDGEGAKSAATGLNVLKASFSLQYKPTAGKGNNP